MTTMWRSICGVAVAFAVAGCAGDEAKRGSDAPGSDAPGSDAPGSDAPGGEPAGSSASHASGAATDATANDSGADDSTAASDEAATAHAAAFTLASSDVNDAGDLDYATFLCEPSGVSPALAWTPGPPGTESYAVVMLDMTLSAPAYEWLLWNIPATTTALPEGVAAIEMPAVPAGSEQNSPLLEDGGPSGYSPRCPDPFGSYTFTVYALDVATLPGLTPVSTNDSVVAAIRAHALASATLDCHAQHYRS